MKDNLIFADQARDGITNGINKIADAVGITMGTAGKNSVIERFEAPGFMLTNDGWTILNSIKLSDPLEELARKFIREAVSRANKSSGDGSSTTTVLTAAILKEGGKYLSKETPMTIKKSLEGAIEKIETLLGKDSKTVEVEDVWQVATISAEDEEIGRRVGDIYKEIGKDGIVQWETAKVPEDSYAIGSGIQMHDAGFVTPYLNDIDAMSGQILQEARLKDVPVILCREKIISGSAFNKIFSELYDKGNKEVAIFCNEITPEAVGSFIGTRAQRGFRVSLIKMPVLWSEEWWEDLAVASGAKIVSQQTGLTIVGLTMEDVGNLGNVLVKKDSVYMDGLNDMTKHILSLKVDGGEDAMLRIARLNTRTARYFVGGYSESAISYRRLKVEDAIGAADSALDGGIVIGGGMALLNVAESLAGDSIGELILKKALQAPALQIMKNAGINPVKEMKKGHGYDTRTGKVVDMFKEGIVDPKKVIMNAVKAAISVAGGILTHGTVVLLPELEEGKMMPNPMLQ